MRLIRDEKAPAGQIRYVSHISLEEAKILHGLAANALQHMPGGPYSQPMRSRVRSICKGCDEIFRAEKAPGEKCGRNFGRTQTKTPESKQTIATGRVLNGLAQMGYTMEQLDRASEDLKVVAKMEREREMLDCGSPKTASISRRFTTLMDCLGMSWFYRHW